MEARELRIGNLVNTKSGILEIESISSEGVNLHTYTDTHYGVQSSGSYFENSLDEIDPIPITKEWLIKFGFTHNGYGEFNLNDLNFDCEYTDAGEWVVFLDQTKEGDKYVSRVYIKQGVRFVHQLQNLYFALTGEELEVKPPA